jgi:hypothetical protein
LLLALQSSQRNDGGGRVAEVLRQSCSASACCRCEWNWKADLSVTVQSEASR